MGSTTKKSEFTVQGLGSPVPASGRGVQAGLGTSLSNDRIGSESGSEQHEVGLVAASLTGDANARQECVTAKLKHQLEELKKQEAEAFAEIGKRIQKIEEVLKSYANVHKSIRTANDEAAILWKRMEEQREEKEELERAYEEALRRKIPAAVHQVQLLERGETAGSSTQRENPNSTKQRAGKSTTAALRRIEKEGDRKKREASSPPQIPTPGKKRKGENTSKAGTAAKGAAKGNEKTDHADDIQEPGWEKVGSRKKEKQRNGNPKKSQGKWTRSRLPEAVAVKVAGDVTYADILRQIKTKVDPAKCGAEITGIRRTRNGEILVEMKKGSTGAENLRNAVATALGEEAIVRTMGQSYTLQIRDLDEVTVQEEIVDAIASTVGNVEKTSIVVKALREGFRGTQTAVVTVPVTVAEKLLETGKLKVGWSVCRVREKLEVLRCFKCLGFGHVARDCEGPDRSKGCRLCGQEDHFAKDCKKTPLCVICRADEQQGNVNHILGSARCPSFQKARRKKANG